MTWERPRAKPDPLVSKGWICVGRLLAPHGVKGLIRLVSYTGDPDMVFGFSDLRCGEKLEPVKLRAAGRHKGDFLVRAEGVATPEAARELTGRNLYAAREELPPLERAGEFYQADLIGLAVRDKGGRKVGTALAFHDYGAGLLLEVGLADAAKTRTILVPFSADVVLKVDVEKREITADLADWL